MVEKEQKEIVEIIPKELAQINEEPSEEKGKLPPTNEKIHDQKKHLVMWTPKTKLGRLVKEGKEKDLDNILKMRRKILEPEIVDSLISLESDLLLIGQAKGKFGGGKRRAWRQTQKKTQEGNIITFSCMAVVGDKNGHVGIGYGRAKETLPAREKAIRNAKLNIIRIELGFESPEAEKDKSDPHTIPFKIEGKCGSIRITLWPAPRGTGLVIGDEGKRILKLAGIKDAYSQTRGKTRTTFNFAKACLDALSKTGALNYQNDTRY